MLEGVTSKPTAAFSRLICTLHEQYVMLPCRLRIISIVRLPNSKGNDELDACGLLGPG
jgi:hypothetical protein